MSDKIDSTEVGGFWDKLFYLVKLITGDVKISTKGTLQNQIDEMSTKVDDCFTSVGDGKKAVASAITDKGVTTAQNAEFATMAANVRKIKTNPTLQAKAITLDTSKTTQTLTPDPGYDGLSQVKASITTQTKSVNLSTSEQVVKPDSGKVLSQVTVPAVTGSAGLKDVVAGKTFNSATAGVDKTGTLLDKRGTTVDAAAVDQDDTYTYFTVPTEAVYDAKSKLRTLSSNLGNKPDFAYSPLYTGNYNNDSHTITVEKNKYYMAVFKDANGAGRCNISKLSINNATIEKSMGDSTNNFCIFWFKANSNSITISGTKTAVAIFFVSELSNDHAYCKNFTSITYVPKGYDYQTYTVPCTKYAMIISMGYQGSQSLSIAVDAESYRQNSFKNIKSYATHSGYHNFGYAHLICESNDNFNVILINANNILVYLS